MDKAARRKAGEKWVYLYFRTLDPSGYNLRYYQELLPKLSDAEFFAWGKRIKEGRTRLWVYAPVDEVFLKIRDIEAAAELVGIPLEEPISQYDESTDRRYTSTHAYPILTVPVRRLKQYQMDKLSVPESDRTLNPLTGQVTKPDKSSSISISEGLGYDSKGLTTTLTEFTAVRGGRVNAYASMRRDLETTGQARMGDLDNEGRVASAQTANTLLTAMHIGNNL